MRVPVRSGCPSVLKRIGGDMAQISRETSNRFFFGFFYVRSMIFLVSLFFLSLSFFFFFLRGWGGGGMTCPETARPLTANWFPDHVDRSKFRHLSELCVNI